MMRLFSLVSILPIILGRFNLSENGRVLEIWDSKVIQHFRKSDPRMLQLLMRQSEIDRLRDHETPRVLNASARSGPSNRNNIYMPLGGLNLTLTNGRCAPGGKCIYDVDGMNNVVSAKAIVTTDCVTQEDGRIGKVVPHPLLHHFLFDRELSVVGASLVHPVTLSPPFQLEVSAACQAVGATTRVLVLAKSRTIDHHGPLQPVSPIFERMVRSPNTQATLIEFGYALFRSLEALHKRGVMVGRIDTVAIKWSRGNSTSPPRVYFFNIPQLRWTVDRHPSDGRPNHLKSPWELAGPSDRPYDTRDEIYRGLELVSAMHLPWDYYSEDNILDKKWGRQPLILNLNHLNRLSVFARVHFYKRIERLNHELLSDKPTVNATDFRVLFEDLNRAYVNQEALNDSFKQSQIRREPVVPGLVTLSDAASRVVPAAGTVRNTSIIVPCSTTVEPSTSSSSSDDHTEEVVIRQASKRHRKS